MSDDVRFSNWFGLGASLGLAILAKNTAYIYALPILVWVILYFFFHRRREIMSGVVVAGVIALCINVGPYRRNYIQFGNVLGSPDETKLYVNEIHSPSAVLSNFVRNVSLHLNTPFASFNDLIEQQVIGLHYLLRIDVNDPRTTFMSQNYDTQYRLSTATRQEIYAGNSIHLLFLGLSILIYLVRARSSFGGRAHLLDLYLWAGLSMFVLFCLVFKWQPFHSRQHLSFFLYFSPFIAVVIINAVKPPAVYGIAYSFLVLSLPWVLLNSSRPLIPVYLVKQLLYSSQSAKLDAATSQNKPYGVFSDKNVQLFREMEPLREPLVQAMNHLAASLCRDFGMIEGTNTYQVEYPIWRLLERNFGDHFRLKHLMVANGSESARFNHPDFVPCVVISLREPAPDQLDIDGALYLKDFETSNARDGSCCAVSLYSKAR